jgi:hypothetical protein
VGITACKPQFEALEVREVMSVLGAGQVGAPSGSFTDVDTGAPTAAGLALINGLLDTPVRSQALADYQTDGVISRNDMIDIFFHGTTGFTDLTSVELASLRTLVNNGPTVSMPEYVQNLASKALAGNLVNAQMLKHNVDNFFLGLVRPDEGGSIVATKSDLPLWEGMPRPNDIPPDYGQGGVDVGYKFIQGAGEINWMLASLEEVVARRPADIMSMFIDNGDNTWTVRFYHGSTPDYVTVDRIFSGPGPGVSISSAELWPQLIVKAYAQETAGGWIGTPQPGVNTYAALVGTDLSSAHNFNSDPAWAFAAITGRSTNHSMTVNPDDIAASWLQGNFVLLHTSYDYSADFTYQLTDGPSVLLNPRGWYALVNYVPDDTLHGRFLFAQSGTGGSQAGQHLIQVSGRVLADNFNQWVESSSNVVSASQQANTAAALDTTASDRVVLIGFPPPAAPPIQVAQPIQVTQNPIQASLVTQKFGRARKLAAHVVFANGRAPLTVLSPFQKPSFQVISAALADVNGDGVLDSIRFVGHKGKRTVSLFITL